ncbi:hypothetical protein SFRURICE_021493, partial [Spodoptera frugiperda]
QVDYDSHDPDYKYTRRSKKSKEKTDGSREESSEEELEKNPGNPFTIHKNKYKQNWLYNHYDDYKPMG